MSKPTLVRPKIYGTTPTCYLAPVLLDVTTHRIVQAKGGAVFVRKALREAIERDLMPIAYHQSLSKSLPEGSELTVPTANGDVQRYTLGPQGWARIQ